MTMSTEQGPKGSIYQQFTNNMKLKFAKFCCVAKTRGGLHISC